MICSHTPLPATRPFTFIRIHMQRDAMPDSGGIMTGEILDCLKSTVLLGMQLIIKMNLITSCHTAFLKKICLSWRHCPHSGWFNVEYISVSLPRNSNALNRVYPTHKLKCGAYAWSQRSPHLYCQRWDHIMFLRFVYPLLYYGCPPMAAFIAFRIFSPASSIPLSMWI